MISGIGQIVTKLNIKSSERVQLLLSPLGREQMFLSRQAKATDACERLNIIPTITHPNLPSIREGVRVVVRFAHSPRPFGERTEFVSELCELRNS